MTRHARLALAVTLAAVMAAACGTSSGSPTAPQVVHANVAGTWSGRAISDEAPEGFIGLAIATTLSQTGTTVVGTFTCGSIFCIGPTATMSATINQQAFTAQLFFANGASCGTFKAAVSQDGARMDGTYICSGPDGPDEGRWSMTKQ
jgi:hypothetical protein